MYTFRDPVSRREALVTLSFFVAHSYLTRFSGEQDSYVIPQKLDFEVSDQPAKEDSDAVDVKKKGFGHKHTDSSATVTPRSYGVSDTLKSLVSNPSILCSCVGWLSMIIYLDLFQFKKDSPEFQTIISSAGHPQFGQ